MKINNRRDILLLLLYSPGKSEEPNRPIIGRTRLVKMLFLFKEEALPDFRKGTEIDEKNFYEFFPWNFGPFSSQVYDDLKFFELRGFIERQDSGEDAIPESAAEWEMWLSSSLTDASEDSYSEYQEEQFRLAEAGVRFVETHLYNALSSAQKRLLRDFRARIEAVPLRAILSYVYKNYQEFTEKSKIREQIVG